MSEWTDDSSWVPKAFLRWNCWQGVSWVRPTDISHAGLQWGKRVTAADLRTTHCSSRWKVFKLDSGQWVWVELMFPQDGVIDFREYVMAISMLIKGSAVQKLRWSFKLYDKDRDGAITRQEMLEIMQVCVSVLFEWGKHVELTAQAVHLSPNSVLLHYRLFIRWVWLLLSRGQIHSLLKIAPTGCLHDWIKTITVRNPISAPPADSMDPMKDIPVISMHFLFCVCWMLSGINTCST